MSNPYDGMTPEQLPQQYTGADAQTFIESYANLPIKGGVGSTLKDYVNTHQPPYGVMVHPFPDVNVLVWYDAADNLHVIEQIPDVVSQNIEKPPYHTADESFLYNLSQAAADAAKKPFGFDMTTIAVIAVAVAVVVYAPQIKSTFK